MDHPVALLLGMGQWHWVTLLQGTGQWQSEIKGTKVCENTSDYFSLCRFLCLCDFFLRFLNFLNLSNHNWKVRGLLQIKWLSRSTAGCLRGQWEEGSDGLFSRLLTLHFNTFIFYLFDIFHFWVWLHFFKKALYNLANLIENEKSRVWKWLIALKTYQSTHFQFSIEFQKFSGPSIAFQVC